MNVLARFASTATALLLLASVGAAQQMTAPVTASVGEEIAISYSNPARAGQTVDVSVRDHNNEEVDVLHIQLDANGNGSAAWTVPTGSSGYEFTADDASTSTAIE